jgi:hypothetical protein
MQFGMEEKRKNASWMEVYQSPSRVRKMFQDNFDNDPQYETVY